MQKIHFSDPAERLDLSYVFANSQNAFGTNPDPIVEMCEVAKNIDNGNHCRAVLVHPGEIEQLIPLIKGSPVRPEVVIDFPDGLGGTITKRAQAEHAAKAGAVGGDIVIDLHKVKKRDRRGIVDECKTASSILGEVKAICQIPFLWQYDKEAVPWLLEALCEGGIYCIKDWTTRNNFLLPNGETLDDSIPSRLAYVGYMSKYISKHALPLIIKVAGRVTDDNVKSFIDAGATLIGTSYRKASSLRTALL